MKAISRNFKKQRNSDGKKTKWLFLILVFGSLVSLVAVGCGKKEKSDVQAAQPRVTLVDVAPVETQDVQVVVRSVGSLEAIDRVEIASEISGIVEEIYFKENQRVAKGQLLLKLDDTKLGLQAQQAQEALETAEAATDLAQATIRRTEADVENTKSSYDRNKELYESGIASESQFIQAKTSYESAQAAVEEAKASYRRAKKGAEAAKTLLQLAKERLSDASIKAPLSGVLGERLVSPGDYVGQGDMLVELVVMDPIEIAFFVPEKYKAHLRIGQPALFETPSVANRTFSGKTSFISPAADPSTRSIKIKAKLSNEEELLQPGLFGAVRLVLETHKDAPVIPESAVVPRGEETFVYVVNDAVSHLRKVILGEHFDGSIEVIDGVNAGETVIIAGQQKVADGYPVRVRETEEAQPEGASSARFEKGSKTEGAES